MCYDKDVQGDETETPAIVKEFAHEIEISLLFSLHNLPYIRRGFNFCRSSYGIMIEVILGFRGGATAKRALSKIGEEMYHYLKTWLQEVQEKSQSAEQIISETGKSKNPASQEQSIFIRFHIRIETNSPSLLWDNTSICGEVCIKNSKDYEAAIDAIKDLSQLLVNIDQPKRQEIDQYLERSYLSRYSSYDMVKKRWKLDR